MHKNRRSSINSEHSSASQSRRRPGDDVFYLECEAAYLSILSSTEKRIKAKHELTRILQQGGRNPSQKKIDEIWEENDDISYRQFCDIMRSIKPNTKEQLLQAFKKIDINGDGFITHSELYRVLTSRGEKMTKSEVKKIIDDGDVNKDGKLDYSEFCTMMLSTSQKCQQMNFKNMQSFKESDKAKPRPSSVTSGRRTPKTNDRHMEEEEESEDEIVYAKIGKKPSSRPPSRPSSIKQTSRPSSVRESSSRPASARDTSPRPLPSKDSSSRPSSVKETSRPSSARTPVLSGKLDNTVKIKGPALKERKSDISEPKSVRSWNVASSKGCFYLDNDDGAMYSHQYSLDLTSATKIWLTSKPIFISQRQDAPSNPIDTPVMILRKSTMGGDMEVAAVTEQRDNSGKFCWQGDLRSGSYTIIPFTSGCRLRRRKQDPAEEVQLIRKDQNHEIQLSKVFRETLSDIFEMCDLDGNGLLSRSEFNWFQLLTSDEEVDDEAWQIVEENFEIKKGELTREGFLGLHLMQAREENADAEEELMDTLQCMGYNKALDMDQACPFEISVHASDCSPDLAVASLSMGEESVRTDKMVIGNIMQSGEKQNLKNLPDVEWYVCKSDSGVSSAIRNTGSRTVEVRVDCSQSRNCKTCKGKDFVLQIVPRSNILVDHVMPEDERQEWFYQCTLYDPDAHPVPSRRTSLASVKSSASRPRSSSKKGSISLF